jgi:hypothetical protein
VTQPGDLWLLGRHKLLCGDSTVATDVERVLGGVEPHLMITDPPYGVDYEPGWRNKAKFSNGRSHLGGALGKVTNDDRCDWRDDHRPALTASSKRSRSCSAATAPWRPTSSVCSAVSSRT